MKTEKIAFDCALSAIQKGNPYPMLSEKTEFPSESLELSWRRKADYMLDTLNSIQSGNVSVSLADRVKEIFVSNSETKNIDLAKAQLSRLLASCSSDSDDKYVEFLRRIVPAEDIPPTVADARRHRVHVAAYVQTLMNEIPNV
jgi:hypothetical protein